MPFPTSRPSPALLVSIVALIVALGGTSYAAITLPKNSVGTTQLKSNAVTSGKVKNGTLLKTDFKAGQLPAGPAGPAGSAGAQGQKGEPGAKGETGATGVIGAIIVQRTDVPLPAGPDATTPGAATSGFATCPAGYRIIGGSVNVSSSTDAQALISRPATDNVGSGAVPDDNEAFTYWKGTARAAKNVAQTMRVFAFCAQTP